MTMIMITIKTLYMYCQTTSTQCMTMIMITIMEGHQGIPNHKELKIKIEWLKKLEAQPTEPVSLT